MLIHFYIELGTSSSSRKESRLLHANTHVEETVEHPETSEADDLGEEEIEEDEEDVAEEKAAASKTYDL